MAKFSAHNSRAAKVTAEMVLRMRLEYAKGATQNELADRYDLSVVQVGRIVRGESWRHVANPAKALSAEELAAVARRLIDIRPDVEQVAPEGETALERMQKDVTQERRSAVDDFLDDNPSKEEK